MRDIRRFARSASESVRRHAPEALGAFIAAAGVVIFQSPLGALVRLPLSIVREEVGARGRRKRRDHAIMTLAESAAELVDRPLLTRGRPELHFWRPNWTISVRSLAAEGFGGLPGLDETWRTLYAAVADDLAELHRSFSVVALGEMADLGESDRVVVKRILSGLTSTISRAMEMSGTSAESGSRWAAKAEDPLAAHRDSERLLAHHRELYPLWRDDLKLVTGASDQLREQSRGGKEGMAIVIIGWGSLCYDWHGLSLVEPLRWTLRGPRLPIEFSRKSKEGERKGVLTAVIDTNSPETVPTRVSESRLPSLAQVREELRVRENRTRRSWIGSVDRAGKRQGDGPGHIFASIQTWLVGTNYSAAVWTAIPPDFGQEPFSVPAAVAYFQSLDPETRQRARNYVAHAPDEVNTPLRRALRDAGLLEGADPRAIDVAHVWTD